MGFDTVNLQDPTLPKPETVICSFDGINEVDDGGTVITVLSSNASALISGGSGGGGEGGGDGGGEGGGSGGGDGGDGGDGGGGLDE
jgi:hypothetical protein